MINHSVFLRQTSPIEPPDPAADARLRERLDAALARYCEGNAAAEDACRKWLAFEAGVLEARRVAPASLLAFAGPFAAWYAELGGPMAYARPLWYFV